jgi:hypothetical protein
MYSYESLRQSGAKYSVWPQMKVEYRYITFLVFILKDVSTALSSEVCTVTMFNFSAV